MSRGGSRPAKPQRTQCDEENHAISCVGSPPAKSSAPSISASPGRPLERKWAAQLADRLGEPRRFLQVVAGLGSRWASPPRSHRRLSGAAFPQRWSARLAHRGRSGMTAGLETTERPRRVGLSVDERRMNWVRQRRVHVQRGDAPCDVVLASSTTSVRDRVSHDSLPTSRFNHARANCQSRFTLDSDIPIASAVSSALRPA